MLRKRLQDSLIESSTKSHLENFSTKKACFDSCCEVPNHPGLRESMAYCLSRDAYDVLE